MQRCRVLRSWLCLAGLLASAACDKPAVERDASSTAPFIEAGDLVDIERRGTLRVLLPRLEKSENLPREGFPLDLEEELVESYARSRGLKPYWIYVETRDKLIPQLIEGHGDFIAANLTVTDSRKKKVRFTVPIATVREQVVARATDDTLRGPGELAGRTIAVRRSSSYWETLAELRRRFPEIRIERVSERVDTEEIIDRVAVGHYDLTVADSNVVESVLRYRDDVKPVLDLTGERPIAWAVRPGSAGLLESLNRFLTEAQLTRRAGRRHTDDLAGIRQSRVLRMLTRNNSACYFLHRGELVGFEYELVREFAREQGLRLEVVVPPNGQDLLPWLVEGRGDLVAAALTPTEARRALGVEFSRPYNLVSQVVVARADETELAAPAGLAGRRVFVRPSSAYWETLERLRASGVAVEPVAAPEELETEEIIARVARGEYDLTLADSHILAIELTWRDDVRGAFALSEEQPLAWAVRASNPELRAAVDEFVARHYRGLYYNVIYDRYYRDEHRIRARRQLREAPSDRLSPYDEIVRRFAEKYGFDWRLIVAQMYQESRFDPTAQSFAGARGLLQVLPRTAEEFGFDPDAIEIPEIGIHAGVRYLDWVRDRFEEELPVRDRMWFALAAYNAGHGHVREARRLAVRQGLDPNRWFGHVERAMLLLARPQYAQQSRYGYCRCTEPVNYVREILVRYRAYVDSLRELEQGRASL